ncbi:hypothetical protein BKA69DRAFT_1096996 [Paraphysoderma sedebokerense]|nr:hypothetical protein BKA69DRAFT_1096996 [Paraphysoderma sedebokerense]
MSSWSETFALDVPQTKAKRRNYSNDEERRLSHNEMERNRRADLHGRVMSLASVIPALSNNPRPSRNQVLTASKSYILLLRNRMTRRDEYLRKMKTAIVELHDQLNELRKQAGQPAEEFNKEEYFAELDKEMESNNDFPAGTDFKVGSYDAARERYLSLNLPGSPLTPGVPSPLYINEFAFPNTPTSTLFSPTFPQQHHVGSPVVGSLPTTPITPMCPTPMMQHQNPAAQAMTGLPNAAMDSITVDFNQMVSMNPSSVGAIQQQIRSQYQQAQQVSSMAQLQQAQMANMQQQQLQQAQQQQFVSAAHNQPQGSIPNPSVPISIGYQSPSYPSPPVQFQNVSQQHQQLSTSAPQIGSIYSSSMPNSSSSLSIVTNMSGNTASNGMNAASPPSPPLSRAVSPQVPNGMDDKKGMYVNIGNGGNGMMNNVNLGLYLNQETAGAMVM